MIFQFLASIILKKRINSLVLPKFKDTEIIRYKITFSGKVHHVGFREELKILAKKIGITGFARNMKPKMVVAEVQGSQEKIDYLLDVIKNEKRFIIENFKLENLELVCNEKEYKINYKVYR